MFRSSYRRCSVTKGVLRNFAKFTGEHLRPATLLKRKPWHRCFPVNFAKFLRTSTVASVRCRTASVCCRRKVAAVKIENLKTFIIKYYDISKTYSVQFHLFYLVTFSYFHFFIHGFRGSRTIAPEKNCPQPQN